MFDWISLDWIYWGISWILLRWHDLWDMVFGDGRVLGTNWDWILAIVFLVLTVRAVLFPLFIKQIKSQRAMQQLQPKIKELQEKYKDDRQKLQQEMMKLYSRQAVITPRRTAGGEEQVVISGIADHLKPSELTRKINTLVSEGTVDGIARVKQDGTGSGATITLELQSGAKSRKVAKEVEKHTGLGTNANPLMGCLPLLLQMPVFFGMFHILRRFDPFQTINTTLYGWTQAQWDSAVEAKLFNAPIAATFGSNTRELEALGASPTTVKVVAGVLVAIMIVTTFLTTQQMLRKAPPTEDPTQLMIQRMMKYGIPATLLISGSIFPIGVVIYWVTTNLFSLAQQQWVLHKYPPPNLADTSGSKGKTDSKPAKGTKPAKSAKAKGAAANGEQVKIDGKALAPRPGVKPSNSKKSNRKRKARR